MKKTREIGYRPTKPELDYIKNDVLIMAIALQSLFDAGLTKMTAASNALHEYKKVIGKKFMEYWFPKPHYDAEIRQAYKGGYVYLNKKYENIAVYDGIILDKNSMYPWVMATKQLPFGAGKFYIGEFKYENDNYNLYIQTLLCAFNLKKDHIPTIQIKNMFFSSTEYLKSSNGKEIILCLTSIDLKIFLEHYDVYNIKYINGWKFMSSDKMFIDYVNKWFAEKEKATIENNPTKRNIAKIMLNSLYGKFAANPVATQKTPYLENDVVKYEIGEPEDVNYLYIPVAQFITAYSREDLIHNAQKLYDRFIYCDTDSLHLIGSDIPTELDIHPSKLGAWDLEKTWTRAKYLRPKSYVFENEKGLNITCAGLPQRCYASVTFDNFSPGMVYYNKLRHVHVKGGIILENTTFSIK